MKQLITYKPIADRIQSKSFLGLGICLCLVMVFNTFEVALAPPTEICDNGTDDDLDGLIDLNDPDCDCPIFEPVSLIPNPSFEEMECCPDDRSQLYCAENWFQASTPTTDFVHTCGWLGWDDFPAPLPFPDGEGAMGFRDGRYIQDNFQPGWKEYAGACLLNPLLAGTKYRFEFWVGFVNFASSPPIDITFFGSTDCDNLPFGGGDQFFGCPTNGPGWVELGSVNVSGINWVHTAIEVTPVENIYAIVIGAPCENTIATTSTYYFFDDLVLADQESFDFVIDGNGHPCSADYSLEVPSNNDFSYQWYKNGIALVGETDSQLSTMYGEGNYQVRILNGTDCKTTQVFPFYQPTIQENLDVTICEGESYAFGGLDLSSSGTYLDTFKTINNCDSIVSLNLEVASLLADTVSVSIFEGEEYSLGNRGFRDPGEYSIHLPSLSGCDSLVVLQLDYYHLFIPNVFSPNGDGSNDVFNVFGNSELVELENLKIFNRWGALLYEGKNILPNTSDGWDGTFKGKVLENGTYIYLATVLMDDGMTRQFSGSVTLLK